MTEPGTRFAAALGDRYLIERELGQGGMPTVYLAHERGLTCQVIDSMSSMPLVMSSACSIFAGHLPPFREHCHR